MEMKQFCVSALWGLLVFLFYCFPFHRLNLPALSRGKKRITKGGEGSSSATGAFVGGVGLPSSGVEACVSPWSRTVQPPQPSLWAFANIHDNVCTQQAHVLG